MEEHKKSEDVASVNVYAAKYLLQKGHRYLDVRTVEEFNNSHVETALNITYMFFTPEGRVKNPDFLAQVTSICKKDDHLVMACNKGEREGQACVDLLNAVGFDHVSNLRGGYSAWLDAGFAGEKPQEEVKSFCELHPLE